MDFLNYNFDEIEYPPIQIIKQEIAILRLAILVTL